MYLSTILLVVLMILNVINLVWYGDYIHDSCSLSSKKRVQLKSKTFEICLATFTLGFLFPCSIIAYVVRAMSDKIAVCFCVKHFSRCFSSYQLLILFSFFYLYLVFSFITYSYILLFSNKL